MAYAMCQRGLNVVVPLWHHRPLIIIIAQFHAAHFHMLFFYQQPGSVNMLRLAAHTVHYHVINNRFVERITTRRVTSGGVQLTSFAPSRHSFEVHKKSTRPLAPIALSLPTELTGRYTTIPAKLKYVYQYEVW